MGKKINTILNLQDKFTPKLSEAGKKALIFKERVKSTEGAVKNIDGALSKMAKAAAATAAAGTAAMGAFAASCVKTYGEFQQSMANVAGIMSIDINSDSYKNLAEKAREAGKATTKTAKEAADAMSYMGLAGWTEEQALTGLMPILRASEATGADLATTSDLITDSMGAMGLKTEQLSEYLDMAAQANNKSNQTMIQLTEAIIGSGGAARAAGVDMYNLSTALGILADNGKKGSEGGTAMNSMLVRMTANQDALSKMKSLGVNVFDTTGKFRGLETILTDLNKAMEGFSDEQITSSLKTIAGTHFYSQFKYLLDSVKEGSAHTSEFKTRWQELNSQLHNSTNALDKMAKTMTNTYEGSFAIANSAVDDFKITIGERLEPYVSQFLNWFAEKLPGATEKFAMWLDTNIPKAVKFCKAAFETIKPVVKFVINHFSQIISVAAGVVVGLKAFSVITKVVALYKKLKAAGTALKVAQLALNASMLACPVTWIAIGIAAVTSAFLLFRDAAEKAKEADIASHFGDIALSAEECGKIVEGVFGAELIGKVDELNYAWDKLDDTFKGLSESATELNKITFMAQMNPKNVTKEDYLNAAQQYIDNMQKALEDKQYELNLDVKFLFGESKTGEFFDAQTNTYFANLLSNAEKLGKELVNNIEKGYKNGWDEQSMKMVAESLEKMSEIQQKVQTAQAEAQMNLLTNDFLMGDLSQESFDTYIEKLNEQCGVINEASRTAAANTMAARKLMLDDGAITQKQYDEGSKKIIQAYEKQSAESLNIGVKESFQAIREVFGKDFDQIAEQLNKDISGKFKINPDNFTENIKELQAVIDESVEKAGVSDGTKEKMLGYLKKILPNADELKKIVDKNPSLWKTYGDTLTSVEALKTLTGKGSLMANTVMSGANSKGVLENAKKAGQQIKEALVKTFSETTKVTLNLDVSYTANQKGLTQTGEIISPATSGGTITGSSVSPIKSRTATETNPTINNRGQDVMKSENSFFGKFKTAVGNIVGNLFGGSDDDEEDTDGGHATGTNYFGGGRTRVNEHGGEIIDLPTGARIYPADKSEKMMNEKQAINVSVVVQGNIFGIDDAVEIIGSKVCDRIVETVNCTA